MSDLSRRTISPKQLKANGWTPAIIDGKSRRCYAHRDGWALAHCGHPTALWPYELWDPKGRRILTGAAVSGRTDWGTAWPTVASAVDYVAKMSGGARSVD